MSLTDVLIWLATSGGASAAASWILEQSDWFQLQEGEMKNRVAFVTSAMIALVSYLVFSYVPADVLAAAQPYFLIVSGLFVSYFLNQTAHVNNPNRR